MVRRITLFAFFIFTFIYNVIAQQNLQQRLENHVQILASDSLEGRGLGTEGREKAIRYIENEMREMGLQPFQGDSYFHHFDFKVGLVNLQGTNVVGMIPGTDPKLKEEYIVIGAHFDHLGYNKAADGSKTIFPGADDNASGVAGILEMARLISASGKQSKRSLVFIAFDAEESGLIGAEYFVNSEKPFPNEAIKAMFSLDMIGMLSTVKSLELKGWRTLAGAEELLALAQERNPIPIKGTAPLIERRTDTWPFGGIGIPSIYVNTGLKSPYHKPEDKADLLDYEGMAKISTFMAGLTLEMANAETLEPARNFNATVAIYGKALKFGAQFGIGSSRNINETSSYREFGLGAVEAGFYSRWRISRTFELAVSTLYDLNGSLVEGERFRRHSITVPALIRANSFYSEDGLFRFFSGVGPYFRQHVRQRLSEGAQEVLGTSLELPDQEWGISLQFGFQVSKITVTTEWRSALTQPFKLPGDTDYYNRNFRVGIAYEF
ncbi:M20/M25/M40 family metallo-hydrolase [Cecembia rubra]|uniref:Peptidase M28-like protein n=1 Tax=Cecembia rubra TaxID=1485585 RepID=A0A2P8DYF1_9BACT|nr:M20/M25/M40 family metallo-hydrolase [Cecembia rubra]PSL02223.1 peptidase M28-like protein [Cecembia rubra]